MTEELKISELPPLSPVPSGELPISQMHGTARVTCKATVQELVQSVATRAHSHTPADIDLVVLRFIYYSPINAANFWYVFRIA